jgi:hypothetical protein
MCAKVRAPLQLVFDVAAGKGVVQNVQKDSSRLMRHRSKLIVLFLFGLVSGCAINRHFFDDCRPAIGTMREYALEHLPLLTLYERKFILTTEPIIAQANYVDVRFKWANVCEVLSSAPPCRPYKVIDLRMRQR